MTKVSCIDISTYQKTVDFKKIKSAGIEAVIIRAGYGRVSTQKDAMFESHYKNAKAAGLKVGAYWYSYADSVDAAKKEAAACLKCVKGKTFDMPIYYDLEDPKIEGLGKNTLTDIAKTFCEDIKAAGFVPGVYANLNWFKNFLDYEELKKTYSIWLAQYSSTNSIKCDIWQNSSTGKVNGISGNVDTNIIFNTGVFTTGAPAATASKKKSINAIAKEVIAGKWYNGVARKSALKKAGYDPDAVQAEVNKILAETKKKSIDAIAKEVIAGKWGNGIARKTSLKKAGYTDAEIAAIQKRVNELL